MYEKEIEQLQKMIDESQNIVFLEAQEYRRRVESRILEVRMVFIISLINIHRNR